MKYKFMKDDWFWIILYPLALLISVALMWWNLGWVVGAISLVVAIVLYVFTCVMYALWARGKKLG